MTVPLISYKITVKNYSVDKALVLCFLNSEVEVGKELIFYMFFVCAVGMETRKKKPPTYYTAAPYSSPTPLLSACVFAPIDDSVGIPRPIASSLTTGPNVSCEVK